jgi:heptosyltransferase-3
MPIEWKSVERVLVIRLRSIGDTVLATPSLNALRRFLPAAQIDILLEDWVAPLLVGHPSIDNVVSVGKTGADRIAIARLLRAARYDAVFNLHGGTTSTLLTLATGARHRVGYSSYQYSFLYNHRLSSSADYWQREFTHSAEQQLALLGSVGIPVSDRPPSSLAVSDAAWRSVDERLHGLGDAPIALIHPAAAFHTKEWPAERFGAIADHLNASGLSPVAVASPNEKAILDKLREVSRAQIETFSDLSLPEITALAARSSIFVGNDSGLAHIAAAMATPNVVIFGSSNRAHWRPWTAAPNAVVHETFDCQPCPGYECAVYGDPKCIKAVSVERVISAIGTVLACAQKDRVSNSFDTRSKA